MERGVGVYVCGLNRHALTGTQNRALQPTVTTLTCSSVRRRYSSAVEMNISTSKRIIITIYNMRSQDHLTHVDRYYI